ncbi:hypothetical protein ACIRFH_16790 [Streptomyces sp. NPDC093586]|uniref:PDC sensor domain-containing protein n=1 Tax=Streptomyces sp. NPDC093586 TaxID=3366042 RepID=UPI0038029DFF
MSTSPAFTGTPRTAGSSCATLAEERALTRVCRELEDVFREVAEVAAATTALLHGVSLGGRAPVSADLAALRPEFHRRLLAGNLISGLGFIAAPGLLRDVPAWMEWWQTDVRGSIRPLLLDLDPARSAHSDYTHWEWFTRPRDTGQRTVAGPYVDYLCSDEYGLTLSVPVHHEGRFAGVAAADIYLRHLEAAVLPVLRELPGRAHLVNARGRVVGSADPAHLVGALTKGPDFGSVLLAGRPDTQRGFRLVPCRGVPIVLVLAEG